jgi:hypothetical protein
MYGAAGILFCIMVWASLACASTVSVQQVDLTGTVACEIEGEIQTGTDVACTKDGIVVRRRSAQDSVGSLFNALLGGLL